MRGLTSTPFDCLFCSGPLLLPRPVKRQVHPECRAERIRAQKREQHAKNSTNPVWVESERARGRDKQRRLRLEVLAAYGGSCACCGEATYEWLTIDHVAGNGADHRREIGRSAIYRWLKKQGYPPGFQVLCWNCNCARGFYGRCPHEESL